MKNIFTALSAAFLTTALAFSASVEADTSVQFGVGYRTDDINWKIDVPNSVQPDSFSKLQFRDIEIFAINGRIKSHCGDCVYYRVDGNYGWILDGSLRESDQLSRSVSADCAECINSECGDCDGISIAESIIIHPRVSNDAKHKYVADFDIAIGYPLEQCWCPNVQIVPTLGFTYSTQRIRVKNEHTIADEIDDLGADPEDYLDDEIERNHNNFRTTWWGPTIGLDFAYCQGECWNLYGEFQYFFGRAHRDRNSATGVEFLDDFRRTKFADGYNLRVGSHYYFRCNWFLDGFLTYKRFHSHDRNNDLTWRAIGVGLALGYTF